MSIEKYELDVMAREIEKLTAERDEWKARCEFSIEQRDWLTAERNEWVAKHKECTQLLGEAMQDRADMAVERELLEALQTCLEALRGSAGPDEINNARENARTAIAKALGEKNV